VRLWGVREANYLPGRKRWPTLEWLVIMQNVVSIALIFFFGLAMRNYFKIK
jgi:hypothetical protein